MKRNAKINSRKLSTLICLVLTLVIAMTAMFVVTASAAEAKATLTFDSNKSNRTSFSTSKQVWEQNGIVFTNNKGSGSNVADYGAPVRLYKGSSISIEAPGNITQIVFKCVSSYVLSTTGTSTSGTTVTVKLDGTSDTYTISSLSSQVRLNSLEVTYTETDCAHSKTTTTTIDATCTENGSIVTKCDACGFKTAEEVITAPGHNYINGVCDVCGAEKPAGYELVSDVSTLKAGDKIVIVAANANKALSTTQNGNNRSTADVTKGNGVVTFGDNVEIITLEAGASAGTFAFKVTAGYLYASGTGNHLRSQASVNANASWTITIANGVATIKSSAAVSQNLIRHNSSSNIFSCYASGQNDVSIYKLPVAEPEQPDVPDCQHTNKTTTTNPAKCESDGSTVVTCADCGEELSRDIIPATGHVNVTTTTVDSTCTTNGTTTVTCNDCGKTVSTETLDKAAHDYDAEGICGVCGFDKNDKGFSGNYAIFAIRSSGNYYVMSSDLGDATTKRYQALDMGVDELPECIYSDHVSSAEHNLIFALEKNEDGTYYLYAVYMESNNYLGWSSENSGTLVAKEDAVKLTVDKLESGLYNIHFTASDAERYLALNNNTGNDYFAFYKSGQKQDLTLLPIVEGQAPTDPENPDPNPGGEPDNPGDYECEHTPRFVGANVNIGDSLTLKVFLDICEHDDISKYNMVFTMNERTVTAAAIDEAPAGHLFVLDGITPQCMGDNIRIQVTKDGAVINGMTVSNYSIKTNLVALLEDYPDDEKLHQLVYDTLAYGAAAQKYCGYKTDALVNAGYEALATQSAQPADTHTLSARADGATASFKSAAVEFGDYNTILIKINATDVTNFKLMFGEVELELGYAGDDVYYAFTDAISALNLKNSYTFTLYENGTVVQTLTYSVNDYASRKWNDAEMGELVKALYAYGVSSVNYVAPAHKN